MKSEAGFDPFVDRLARDIRNELSQGFVEGLKAGGLAVVEEVAGRYLAMEPGPVHAGYINQRLARYRAALARIRSGGELDLYQQALVLWDEGLFFEVHELLEQAWHRAAGEERLLLQALIRAAGTYELLAAGNRKGAQGMAAKAADALEELRQRLPACIDLDRLLPALRDLDRLPPRLLDDKL